MDIKRIATSNVAGITTPQETETSATSAATSQPRLGVAAAKDQFEAVKPGIGEASFEYLIGSCEKLNQQDHQNQLQTLSGTLNQLKQAAAGKQETSASAGTLEQQLAKVDVGIKELVSEIHTAENKETDEQDSVKSGQEQNHQLSSAAEKQEEILDDIKKLFGN